MIKYGVVIGVCVVLLITGFFVFYNQTSPPQTTFSSSPTSQPDQDSEQTNSAVPREYTAKFLIFTNGTKRVFTDPKYHNQSEDVFIEYSDPTVIQVKRPNITWGGFFDTLPAPMRVTTNCLFTGTGQQFCNTATSSLKFYRNGERNDDALTEIINPNDQLLVSYGNESDSVIQQQLEEFNK